MTPEQLIVAETIATRRRAIRTAESMARQTEVPRFVIDGWRARLAETEDIAHEYCRRVERIAPSFDSREFIRIALTAT